MDQSVNRSYCNKISRKTLAYIFKSIIVVFNTTKLNVQILKQIDLRK